MILIKPPLDPDRPLALGDCGHWWQPVPEGLRHLDALRERFSSPAGEIHWACPSCCGPTLATLVDGWKAAVR